MARNIEVRIIGDASSLRHALGQAEGAVGSFGSKIGHLAGTGLRMLGAAALAGGAAAATGIGFAIKAAADFESQLNNMQAVSGATGAEMLKVSQLAKDLGADLTLPGTSAADAALAMTELAKGGLSVDESMNAAKGTIQLAAAAGTDVGNAATIAADNLNAFGLAGTEAGRVADVLTNAANASSGEIDDFALALKQSAAVASKNFGMSIEETTTLLMELAKSGIKGSDAGTSLKTMMMKLVPTAGSAKAAMKELGVHTFDASGKFVGIRNVIGQYQKALGPLTQEQRAQALQTIFGSDAVRAATIIFGEGTEGYDAMAEAAGKTGSAQEIAAAKMKGFHGAVEGLKSALSTVAITIGEPLLNATTGFVTKLSELVGWFDQTVSGADSFGEALSNVASGIKEKLGEIDWNKVMSKLGSALGSALSTIGRFLGDIDWSGVLKAIGGGLSKAMVAVSGWLKDVDWGKVFGTAFGALTAFLTAYDYGKVLGNLGGFAVKLVAGLAGAVAKADWGTIGAAVLKGLKGALEGIAGELVAIGKPWGAALGEVIWDMAKDVGQAAAKVLEAFAAVVAGFGGVGGWLKGIPGIGEQFEGMDKAAQGAAKRIEEIASNMRDLKSPADKAADEVERLRDRFEELRGEATGLPSSFDRAKGAMSAFAGQVDVADAAVLILTESLHRMPTKAEIKAFLKDAEAKAAIEALVKQINGMPGKKDIKADFLSKEAARLADELNSKVKAIPDKSTTIVSTPGAVESRNKLDDVTGAARGIPGVRSTHVSTPGTWNAVGALGNVRDAVYRIPTSWSTTVTTFFRTVGTAFGFAHGGVSPGGMALVGEQGPELVGLPRGARVFSNPQSRRMMSGGQAGGMGGPVINVYVAGSVMTERDLVQVVRDGLLQGPGNLNPSLWGARA